MGQVLFVLVLLHSKVASTEPEEAWRSGHVNLSGLAYIRWASYH